MIRITTVAIYKVLDVTVYVGGEAMEGIIFITAAEMAEILGISKPYAYKIIKQLNEELEAKGFITIPGRVSKKYFEEKFYGAETA
jgi:predicted DNA-binding transcriptional regulator AlpA